MRPSPNRDGRPTSADLLTLFRPLAPTRRPSRFSHARSQAPGVRLPQAIPHVGGLKGPRHGAMCGPRVGARTGAGGTQGHT